MVSRSRENNIELELECDIVRNEYCSYPDIDSNKIDYNRKIEAHKSIQSRKANWQFKKRK